MRPPLHEAVPASQFTNSRELQSRSHEVIPGGCHTYAKGDDQFPLLAPGFISRGYGCHVWDVDENEYIEYGMGCRAVTLGHAFEPVVEAARSALDLGTNFTRPHPIEVACADDLLGMIEGAEMVKFAKNGSDATTAAVRLARAYTGRDRIALCKDHPFFAINDWFIGTTPMDAGIPSVVRDLSVSFRYGDLDSVRSLFEEYPGKIAGVILEPAKYSDPVDGYLQQLQQLCRENGAVFILDEIITGFRWDNGGAQKTYGIVPDLATFGKAMANGFSAAALAGRREIMELGGIKQRERERVFLLSTTNGAETHALAAAIATMRTYRTEPVVETLHRQGERLQRGLDEAISRHDMRDYVKIIGRPCALVFATLDAERQPSQHFRALFMQELIRRGVIGPSFVISYSHSDDDVDRTIDAVDDLLPVYRRALQEGIDGYLVGPPTQLPNRRFNT